jgi:hypothetical protein
MQRQYRSEGAFQNVARGKPNRSATRPPQRPVRFQWCDILECTPDQMSFSKKVVRSTGCMINSPRGGSNKRCIHQAPPLTWWRSLRSVETQTEDVGRHKRKKTTRCLCLHRPRTHAFPILLQDSWRNPPDLLILKSTSQRLPRFQCLHGLLNNFLRFLVGRLCHGEFCVLKCFF